MPPGNEFRLFFVPPNKLTAYTQNFYELSTAEFNPIAYSLRPRVFNLMPVLCVTEVDVDRVAEAVGDILGF